MIELIERDSVIEKLEHFFIINGTDDADYFWNDAIECAIEIVKDEPNNAVWEKYSTRLFESTREKYLNEGYDNGYNVGYNDGWNAGRKRLIEQIEEKAGIVRKERKNK